MIKEITLLEALTGTNYTFEHLDKKIITVSTIANDVISDGAKKTLRNLGMPFFKEPMNHGNLIIQFKVIFPKGEELKNSGAIELLKKVLPGPQLPPLNKE